MKNKNKTTNNKVLNDNFDQKMFLEDWYSNPITKNRLAKTAALNQDPNFNTYGFETKVMMGLPEYVGYNNDASSLLSNAKYKVATANKLSNNPDGWNPEAYGGYSSEKNAYHVNKESDKVKGTVDIHELSHASDLDYINDRVWKDKNKGPLKEIYPRINEIRYFSKFKPGQIINMNDVSKFKESSGYQDLKRVNYSDEEILDLLNNMALNSNNNTNSVQARNGGQLNMKKKDTKQYFDGGSILSLLGGATNLIPKDNAAGGATSGAINGASSLAATGNPYLMGAGALIGGVTGGIQGNKQNMQNQINPYSDGVNNRNNFLNIMADGGLIEYNTGGTHEQNPLGGIPQGVAPGGQTNTVEEGETRLKDFIFSDRLKVNKSMAKKFNLPDKFIGKSFADVSKTYNKELEDRPNDPFSKKTVDLNMNNLMLANQEVAGKKMTNTLADGGYLSPSQYSQQMQGRDFSPAIPMLEPMSLADSQLPKSDPILDTQLVGMPTTFLGTAQKNWPIQDKNLLNTPNMPDRARGINPQMVSEGQQARGYNQDVGNYLRDIGRIINQSQTSGDVRSQDEITRDIVGDYNKQPLTTVPFPKTFADGGPIKRGNIGDFYDPSNPSLPFEGYKPANGSDWTRRGYMGNDFKAQNEWVKSQTTPDNIKMWLDPESELNKGVTWRQDYINTIKQQQPNLYSDLLSGKVPANKLQELYTEKEVGPIQSLVGFPAKNLESSGNDESLKKIKTKDYGLAPMKNNAPNVGNPGTPPTSMKVPNLWPEFIAGAGLLVNGMKPKFVNPTLTSVGNIKAPLHDIQTFDKQNNENFQTAVGAGANYFNGNAAAMRGNLQGLAAGANDARGRGYLQMDTEDMQSRYNTDSANLQNQFANANNNAQRLWTADYENAELKNNFTAKKMDDSIFSLRELGEQRNNNRVARELNNARAADIFAATGYAPSIPQTTVNLSPGTPGIPNHQLTWDEWNKSKNQQKLASDVNFSCGGAIKTRRRGLK